MKTKQSLIDSTLFTSQDRINNLSEKSKATTNNRKSLHFNQRNSQNLIKVSTVITPIKTTKISTQDFMKYHNFKP